MSEFTSGARWRLTAAFAAALALWPAAVRGQAEASPEPPAPAPTAAQSPLAGSNWLFLAGGSARLTYDDNPFIQPNGGASDTYFDLAPTLAAGLGDFESEVQPFADIPHFLVRNEAADLPDRDLFYVRYTPDFQWWDRDHGNDTVNEDVETEGRIATDRIDLAGTVRVQSITSPDIDIGERIRQIYDTADLTGKYALSGRTDVGAELYGDRSAYTGGLASTDFWGEAYADYALAPKVSAGLGAAAGGMTVNQGPDQSYWRPVFRWSYLPTGKLSFQGDAGAEFRSFRGARAERADGIADLSASYQASASTTLTLSGQRQTTASGLYADEDMEQSLVQVQLQQRLFREFYGKLAGGFARDDYFASARTAAFTPRRDDYGFVRLSAACDFTRHGTIELSYEHRRNDSTDASFGFDENLVAAQVSLLY